MRLVLAVLVVGVVAVFVPEAAPWRLVLGAALAVALIDAVFGWDASACTVVRRVDHSLPVNRNGRVRLEVANRTWRTLRVLVDDEVPADTVQDGLPALVTVCAGGRVIVDYRLGPRRRGDCTFGDVVAWVSSPLALWDRRIRLAQDSAALRVYPDFSAIGQYLALAADKHVSRLGVHVAPRRGEGLEFHQLRDHRAGDTIRQIDWKASARRRNLVSREYQEERDQRVVFLMDNGRTMRSMDGRLSHFDHALNAMLLLAYVALRQGDRVSVRTFGAQEVRVPEQRGVGSINALLNAVYDLHTGPEAADYVAMAESVMADVRKRSLVVLMTNLREADEDLLTGLDLLRRRHVVLLANLRERSVNVAVHRIPGNFDEALEVAGAANYLERRRQLQAAGGARCSLVVDCVPEELPVQVVNGYWRIKRGGAL